MLPFLDNANMFWKLGLARKMQFSDPFNRGVFEKQNSNG